MLSLWDVHFYNEEGHCLGSVPRVEAESRKEAIRIASEKRPDLAEDEPNICAVHHRAPAFIFPS